MAIVPYKQWEEMKRWREEHRPRLPPNPNVVHTVNFQKDLSSVLADEDMSEAEKTQKYGETLRKFKIAHQKALRDARMPSSVWLRKNLTWDEDGSVKVHGKPLAGYFIDLVNDTLRQRKHSEPKGWQTFAQMLKESNVPRDYVGNKKRKDFMYGGDEDDDDGEFEWEHCHATAYNRVSKETTVDTL